MTDDEFPINARLPKSLIERMDEHVQHRRILDDPTTRSDLIREALDAYLEGFEEELQEALRLRRQCGDN